MDASDDRHHCIRVESVARAAGEQEPQVTLQVEAGGWRPWQELARRRWRCAYAAHMAERAVDADALEPHASDRHPDRRLVSTIVGEAEALVARLARRAVLAHGGHDVPHQYGSPLAASTPTDAYLKCSTSSANDGNCWRNSVSQAANPTTAATVAAAMHAAPARGVMRMPRPPIALPSHSTGRTVRRGCVSGARAR